MVYFPVRTENFDRSKNDVSVWEQVENVAQMQYYWADNQVSATITFRKEEARDIPKILELYETRLKSISFLPLVDHQYAQAPYQEISKEMYEHAVSRLKPLDFSNMYTDEAQDLFCDGDKCELIVPEKVPQTAELEFDEAEPDASEEHQEVVAPK